MANIWRIAILTQRHLDKIGLWSLVKLEIVKEYASAYCIALKKYFELWYIDAFAGAGVHRLKKRNTLVPGSPINALKIVPAFDRYVLIDLNGNRTAGLNRLIGKRSDVLVRNGDCNSILRQDIFTELPYVSRRRALCNIDPYGMTLDWQTIAAASATKTVDLIINFPIHDMNRSVLHHDRAKVSQAQKSRMNVFWGDKSWEEVVYKQKQQQTFFGETNWVKGTNRELAAAYRARLKSVAGFAVVPEPIAMRNSKGSEIFYLFFASHANLAGKIASDILRKYKVIGGLHVAKLFHRMD